VHTNDVTGILAGARDESPKLRVAKCYKWVNFAPIEILSGESVPFIERSRLAKGIRKRGKFEELIKVVQK